MQPKKGLTLIEVLISMTILGIVAAITIYILINVIPKEHEYLAKKPAVTLSNGVKTLLENDKIYPNKSFEDGEQFCNEYSKIFKDINSSNCTIYSNISDNNFQPGDKIPNDIYALTNLTTSTGETWIGLNQNFKDENTPIQILIDVNGPNKGRNIFGEDVVILSLYQNGKIGEFEENDSSTDKEIDKYIDCSRCTLIKTPVENSCSAAYKGKFKLICESYPQCSKDGGPYACCAYILNHPQEFSWGNWTTQGRATTDDLGNICYQSCKDLVRKTKITYCGNKIKEKYYAYYLEGSEIISCRKYLEKNPCICTMTGNLGTEALVIGNEKGTTSEASFINSQVKVQKCADSAPLGTKCSFSKTYSLTDIKLPNEAKITKCTPIPVGFDYCQLSTPYCNNRGTDTHNKGGMPIGSYSTATCLINDDGKSFTITINAGTILNSNKTQIYDFDDSGVREVQIEYETTGNCL